ncbi:MAG: hypothetical protein ACYC1C_13340 [Chloroflexota bacterium]
MRPHKGGQPKTDALFRATLGFLLGLRGETDSSPASVKNPVLLLQTILPLPIFSAWFPDQYASTVSSEVQAQPHFSDTDVHLAVSASAA